MSDALMDQLRESLLLERARKIYRVTLKAPPETAILMVSDILRITRDEGIAVGLGQTERHAAAIEASHEQS